MNDKATREPDGKDIKKQETGVVGFLKKIAYLLVIYSINKVIEKYIHIPIEVLLFVSVILYLFVTTYQQNKLEKFIPYKRVIWETAEFVIAMGLGYFSFKTTKMILPFIIKPIDLVFAVLQGTMNIQLAWQVTIFTLILTVVIIWMCNFALKQRALAMYFVFFALIPLFYFYRFTNVVALANSVSWEIRYYSIYLSAMISFFFFCFSFNFSLHAILLQSTEASFLIRLFWKNSSYIYIFFCLLYCVILFPVIHIVFSTILRPIATTFSPFAFGDSLRKLHIKYAICMLIISLLMLSLLKFDDWLKKKSFHLFQLLATLLVTLFLIMTQALSV
ncbi:hypothetical protein LJC31_03355 [Synergistaceae bacterium OttesenSCG-928-I11]|nr:hypothetical protein [Synergistaceae bacterium OttesenSCG-928-I11]